MAVSAVLAVEVNPDGAVVTLSPWLIQTLNSFGNPDNNFELELCESAVRPNSDFPVCVTTPPSAAAIT